MTVWTRGINNSCAKNSFMFTPACTHSAQTLPQVCVDGVLVAVAFQVGNNPHLKYVRAQELPQHVQDTRTLTNHTHTLYAQVLSNFGTKHMTLQ